jgi:hypothetical protein
LQRSDLKLMASRARDFEICVVCFEIPTQRRGTIACAGKLFARLMHRRTTQTAIQAHREAFAGEKILLSSGS